MTKLNLQNLFNPNKIKKSPLKPVDISINADTNAIADEHLNEIIKKLNRMDEEQSRLVAKKLCELDALSNKLDPFKAYAMPQINRSNCFVERYNGKNVITTFENKGGVYSSVSRNIKTGELVRLQENGYALSRGRDGALIATEIKPGEGKVAYEVVTDKNGNVVKLSEWSVDSGTTVLKNEK